MVTKTLIAALDRADSPRAVSAAIWGLEKWTGVKTQTLIEHKGNSQAGAADWYQREGFYKLAALKGGTRTYTGQAITTDSALEFSGVLSCVKILAEDTGGMPFDLFERSKSGDTIEKAYGNSLYKVLHDAANPQMSAGEFREAMTSRVALGMDGFARIVRGGSKQVIALYPIPTEEVTVHWNANNQPTYSVKEGSSKPTEYATDEIFHLRGFTFDGKKTDDIIKRARNAIAMGLSADEYAARFFANDAAAGVVISFPAGQQPMSKEKVQEFKDAWKKWHQGVSNSHEPAVVQGGAEVKRDVIDNQKLQFHESRRYQIIEIARIYRMPLHKLADLDRATNNNIEHQGLEYIQHTLGPWRRRWEEAVHRCLLTLEERYWPNGRPRMYAEFNVEALVRGDFATQSAGFATGLQNGYYTVNEVRKRLNLNPIEGGNIARVPLNLQDITAIAADAVAQQVTPIKEQLTALEHKLGGASAALRG